MASTILTMEVFTNLKVDNAKQSRKRKAAPAHSGERPRQDARRQRYDADESLRRWTPRRYYEFLKFQCPFCMKGYPAPSTEHPFNPHAAKTMCGKYCTSTAAPKAQRGRDGFDAAH
jgi:hypothetical protein